MGEKHKRYLVFVFGHYYPSGGIKDLEDSFDTVEEARELLNNRVSTNLYGQIYDRVDGVIIFSD